VVTSVDVSVSDTEISS